MKTNVVFIDREQGSGWDGLRPAQLSPWANFFFQTTMGWARPKHFFGGHPWAGSFDPYGLIV